MYTNTVLYEHLLGKNNVPVIFAIIIIMNDDVHNTLIHVLIGLYQQGRENDT